MWDIGQYNRYVTIKRPTEGTDDSHAPTLTFAEWKKVWMSKKDTRLAEGIEQDKNTGDRTTIWKTAHWIDGLTIKDILVFDDVEYEIIGIRDIQKERHEIQTITKY